MEVKRLFDCIDFQAKKYPLAKSISFKRDDTWQYYSTEEIQDMVNKAAGGLLSLGLKPGDRVGLVTYINRPEFSILDIAMAKVGIVSIPVYPTISSADYEYIFNDANVEYVFVGGGDLYDKVSKAKTNIPSLKEIFTFDKKDGFRYWEEIWTEEYKEQVKELANSIDENDLATVIYTSGTTGNPKGVMLTHKNILSNMFMVNEVMPHQRGDRTLSFLPLCHIFERTASYSYMYNCFEIIYTGTDNLGGENGDLATLKPHFFTTVPRLLEKVYEKLYNKGMELSGIKKKLFFWALDKTKSYEYNKKYTGFEALSFKVADKLIYDKWRSALGGNIKGILTGAAACPMRIKQVFSAAGIPIREGYGLTESSPGIAIGRYDPTNASLNAIGPPLKGVDILIDDSDGNYAPGEGEILAAGDNIMIGYLNRPAATNEVLIKKDGKTYLKTGDIGKMIDVNGIKMLKITDRKKELLKTSGGKYVAPAPIEAKFKEDFLVENIMVIGEKQKFVSALIIPAEEALKQWCIQQDIPWTGLSDAIKKPKVLEKFDQIKNQINPNFSHIEQVKVIKLLDIQWEPTKTDSTESELTPTLKLKRRIIREKHAEAISQIYS